jgi:hypothetical protein
MRTVTIMLSGLLVLGLAGTAEAKKGKDEGDAASPAMRQEYQGRPASMTRESSPSRKRRKEGASST